MADERYTWMFRCLLISALLSMPSLGIATNWAEQGDAGEFMATAGRSDEPGALSRIDGALIDLGGNVDDIDMYRIYVIDPDVFSVVTAASLSEDNDAQLHLFDAAGNLILSDDDGLADDDDLQPEFFAGALAGRPIGVYYLAYGLFTTQPTLSAGRLAGWARNPSPFQTGDYSLYLSGTLNKPPALLDAGADRTVSFPGPAQLAGYHWGSVPTSGHFGWLKSTGPGDVTFADARAAATTATFSLPGQYTLLFWYYTGGFYPFTDEVVITVTP